MTDQRLDAEHAACLADAALVARCRAALAAARARRQSASETYRLLRDQDSYAAELGALSHCRIIERCAERAKPDGWHGWLTRDDIERALRSVGEDEEMIMTPIDASAGDFVLVRSDQGDGGWSLHAPGSTDEAIASGDAPYLVSGEAKWDGATGEWDRPNDLDYRRAFIALYERSVGEG